MKTGLLRSKRNTTFFEHKSNDAWNAVEKNEMCLVLPIKASTPNSVVVLCRYGIKEILCPVGDPAWEEL